MRETYEGIERTIRESRVRGKTLNITGKRKVNKTSSRSSGKSKKT